MSNKEKIEQFVESSNNGVISTAEITKAGLNRASLKSLISEEKISRFKRGIYVRNNVLEDELFLLQCNYKRGIYSHNTALYLLGYSDRAPSKYTMTFPKGYNAPSLKQENLSIKRVIPANYSLGVTIIKSLSGNPIYVYDLERTLCDILRGKGDDQEIIKDAMKRYAASTNKNIHKLMKYAKQLHVESKILRYMEVLL